jgi:NAD(P)-dependent dehydrogenase (short-subunit alcohol dehydrogenase family)
LKLNTQYRNVGIMQASTPSFPPTRFSGQTVVVTGAGGGIGSALTARLIAEGASVVCVDRPSTPCHPDATAFVGGDVADPRLAAEAVGVAMEIGGRLDGLVNNAGIMGPSGRLHTVEEADWAEVISVNLTSVWLAMRAALPVMVEQGGGAIVNTASVAGLGSSSLVGPYGVTKAGVVSLTKTAAIEYAAAGVRVNAVCPGPIDTSMLRDLEVVRAHGDTVAKGRDRILRAVPMRRYAQPEEVAASIAFLLSDDAAYVTGTLLPIDGGMRAL